MAKTPHGSYKVESKKCKHYAIYFHMATIYMFRKNRLPTSIYLDNDALNLLLFCILFNLLSILFLTISTNRNLRPLEAASDRITPMIVAGPHSTRREPFRRLGRRMSRYSGPVNTFPPRCSALMSIIVWCLTDQNSLVFHRVK